VDVEIGIGQIMEIENGPALTLEDHGASEAQHTFRDDAIGGLCADRKGGQHEKAGERRVSNNQRHISIGKILTPTHLGIMSGLCARTADIGENG